ncbi:LamG domain-containing protein [Planctomycetota bacterium]
MFEKKPKLLMVIFLVLGLALASQAQQYATWVGNSADANGLGFWDIPGNWDIGSMPTEDYWAVIPGPNTTVVVDDFDPELKVAADITMAGGQNNVTLLVTSSEEEGAAGEGNSLTCSRFFMAGTSGQNVLLQMDAGELNLGQLVVCGNGSDVPDAPVPDGTVIINGGVANLGSLSLTETSNPSKAILIMNGGELNISSKLTFGQPPAVARIELNGGIANIGKLDSTPSMTMDINNGILVLDGDQTIQLNGLVTTGQLTVAGQIPIRGGLSLDYDAGTDKTTASLDPDVLAGVNKAWNPIPTPSAVDLPIDTSLLSWSAGDATGATGGHDVYVGTDSQAVLDDSADNAMGTYQGRIDTTEMAMPGEVILGQTYYWRVDQIAPDGTLFKGDLWSFTIVDSLVVDLFEHYVPFGTVPADDPNLVFNAWKDGYLVADNGSTTSLELVLVQRGEQAMKMDYDNNDVVVNSEAKRTFDTAQDWSTNGIKSLSLLFRADSVNTFGTVYVKINDKKVPYPLSTQHLKFAQWQSWIVDLNDVQTDLGNVTSLAFGVDGTGSGTFYVDHMKLYAMEGELRSEGAEPDSMKLLAHYPFDGNAQDISGNGRHGTVVGTPNWVDGALNGALDMTATRGVNGGDFDPTGGTGTFTLTTWCYWTVGTGVQHLMTKQNGWGTNSMMFQIEIKGSETWVNEAARNRLHIAYANAPQARFFKVPHNEWSHITLAFDGTHATAYLNGVDLDGPQPTGIGKYVNTPCMIGAENSGSRLLEGVLDDFRLYSYPLTQEEVLGTIDVDLGYKPF